MTAPLFAFVALAIKRDSPGPVFFRQTRLGKDQRPFTALKFRTMRVGADTGDHRDYIKTTMSADAAANGNGLYKLEREDAVTRVGRWLRATSLDELPQLINVAPRRHVARRARARASRTRPSTSCRTTSSASSCRPG